MLMHVATKVAPRHFHTSDASTGSVGLAGLAPEAKLAAAQHCAEFILFTETDLLVNPAAHLCTVHVW